MPILNIINSKDNGKFDEKNRVEGAGDCDSLLSLLFTHGISGWQLVSARV